MINLSPRFLARVIAGLILLSCLVLGRLPLGLIFSTQSYTSLLGFLTVLNVLPWLITIAGAILLFTKGRIGYPLIYTGYVLSFLGYTWYFFPFLHLLVPVETFFGGMVALATANSVVIGCLIWCHITERRSAIYAHAV